MGSEAQFFRNRDVISQVSAIRVCNPLIMRPTTDKLLAIVGQIDLLSAELAKNGKISKA